MPKKPDKAQKSDRSLIPLMVYLPPEVDEQVKRIAGEQSRRPGNMARRMIEEWIEEHAALAAK